MHLVSVGRRSHYAAVSETALLADTGSLVTGVVVVDHQGEEMCSSFVLLGSFSDQEDG